MRDRVLASVVEQSASEDLWDVSDEEPNNRGARDLVRALSWLMLIEVEGPPWSWVGARSAQQEQADRMSLPVVRNETRWPTFVRWAHYLGFCAVATGYSVMPDPTVAVDRSLSSQLHGRGFQPLEEVLTELAVSLPFLDGGVVNRAMRERYEIRWDDDALSPALTLALLRLAAAGHLAFDEGRGDAAKVTLAHGQGAYHAVRWEGA